jgi:CD9 antigen
MKQFVGVGVLAVSLWLLFDSAFYLQVAKGADSYSAGTFTLLAAGALMTIIGFLGCCGALRESQCLLGTVI